MLIGYLMQPKEAIAEPLPDIKTYSIHKVLDKFGGGQWTHFNELIWRESKWKPNAQNPRSTAFGLGQFLNSTWETVDCIKTADPYIQIDCTIAYIESRYGSPEEALKFHTRKNWY